MIYDTSSATSAVRVGLTHAACCMARCLWVSSSAFHMSEHLAHIVISFGKFLSSVDQRAATLRLRFMQLVLWFAAYRLPVLLSTIC